MKRSLLIGIITTMTAVAVSAAPIIVTPSSPNWVQTNSDSSVSGSFVTGPGTPPAGDGSFQMTIGADGDQFVILRNDVDFLGLSLSELTGLSYSTYQQNYIDGQAIILSIVLSNGDRLRFEPVYQNGTYSGDSVPDQCPGITACADLNTWQTWNALAGGWWDDFGFNGSITGPPNFTLAHYAADNPLVTIQAIRFVAGGGAGAWDNFAGNVDNLTVSTAAGSTTYDFEAVPEPGTIVLMSIGLAGCGLLSRKRRAAKV